MQFANHVRELKCEQNIFQPTLAVSAQHKERLRLKFITFCTTIVLQKYMNPFEQPPEDEERKHHHMMIAMNNRITVFDIVTAAISLHFSFFFSISFEPVCWSLLIRNEKIRSYIDRICVSRDSECALCPLSSKPPITA